MHSYREKDQCNVDFKKNKLIYIVVRIYWFENENKKILYIHVGVKHNKLSKRHPSFYRQIMPEEVLQVYNQFIHLDQQPKRTHVPGRRTREILINFNWLISIQPLSNRAKNLLLPSWNLTTWPGWSSQDSKLKLSTTNVPSFLFSVK